MLAQLPVQRCLACMLNVTLSGDNCCDSDDCLRLLPVTAKRERGLARWTKDDADSVHDEYHYRFRHMGTRMWPTPRGYQNA